MGCVRVGCWCFFTIEYELTRAFARVGEEWPRNCVQWHNAPEMHLIFLKVQYICNFFAITATIKYSFSNCSSTCFSELISYRLIFFPILFYVTLTN